MLLIAEKNLKNVKILAITCVDGNTDVENGIKNTYRMLWGLNRTDVSMFHSSLDVEGDVSLYSSNIHGEPTNRRFLFIKVPPVL